MSTPPLPHAALTEKLIGTFYEVYNDLGHGYAESVYQNAMAIAFEADRVAFQREPEIDVSYRGQLIGSFRADFVIAGVVILELKAAYQLNQAHEAQLLNYLRASGIEVGLLLNFGPRPSFRRLIHRPNHQRWHWHRSGGS